MPRLLVFLLAINSANAVADATPEVVVTASREPRTALELVGNTARLDQERIALTSHQHVHELGNQVTGTWVSRGSGQEHLTAIRSPVLTGAGACGAFLMLEDGIPIRPTGFCNVNQLFEIPTELAASTEVLRGPAGAAYGSNGLHGVFDFQMPAPGDRPGWSGSAEVGPDDFLRGRLGWDGDAGKNQVAGGMLADHYGGFRETSGYEQQKAFVRLNRDAGGGELGAGLTLTNLDQDTAGFVRGRDAYRDPVLRVTNPNPEAFRKADSQRLFVRWSPQARDATRTDWRFFARRSDMEFLQHFLPGQPLEENGQVSGGAAVVHFRELADWRLTIGADAETASGFLKETQFQDLGPGSSRPVGTHYDYDVVAFMLGPYIRANRRLGKRWDLQAGLRLEYLYYDYENNLADGNAREDGSQCPGGCLFFRPADRSDDFFEAAPEIGLLYRISNDASAYLKLSRGFRAPQATELYRLQSGQAVADLDPETIDSIELGWRRQSGSLRIELSAFAMRKRNFIFRDADGFNVSDGRTEHVGGEIQARFDSEPGFYAGLASTYAKHTYDFDRDASRGETISSGNDVDTAPRTLGSLQLGYDPGPGLAEVEWVHQGDYYLDAANTARYPGHDLLNIRLLWRVMPDWTLALRINNVTDERYADRADFAFGSYRYLPGREREFFVQLAYRSF